MRFSCILLLMVFVVTVGWCAELPAEVEGKLRSVGNGEGGVVRQYWAQEGKKDEKRRDQERRARIREYWERQGRKSVKEWEKRREELKGLPPEARREKIRKWREAELGHGHDVRKLTAEERMRKRREMLSRLKAEMAVLAAKQEKGELTEAERLRLRHLGELQKRFDRRRGTGEGEKNPEGDPDKRCGIKCGPCLSGDPQEPVVFQQGSWRPLTRI